MAHDTDSTNSIFNDIAKGIHSNLITEIKELPKKSNSKELIFDSLDTSWRIATAGSPNAGRGKRLQFLHNSEKAFWKDMRKNALAISQALTPTDSIEIDETTANGMNEFYEDWIEIEEGNSKWIGVFFKWYNTSEYTKDFKGTNYSEEEFINAINNGTRFFSVDSNFMKKLKSLKNNVGLTLEQLNWYFDKRIELKESIAQEYPNTSEEAFMSSGTPYFDIELIDILINELKYKEFMKEKNGEIEIFETPEHGVDYVVGSDVAEGLDDGDSSTFSILRVDTREEVASAEYKSKPDEHGRILAKYGRIYNNALISVEVNNHGHSTLNTLQNEEMYDNLYMRETMDKKNNTVTKKVGWITTAKSKFIMLDEIDSAMRKKTVTINSVRTLKQMRGIQKENGKVNVNGKDRIVALAIAYQALESAKNNKLKTANINWR